MNKILQGKNKQEYVQLSGKEGSVGKILTVAFPLIISMAGSTVMQFINRMFPAHYSTESMAACVPGGILSLTFLCFFMGLVNYSNAFVSQYSGKGQRANISRSVWQAVWLAIASGIIIQITIPIGYFIIGHAGHDPAVAVLEKEYFFWLTVTAALPLLGNAVCVLCSWWFISGGAGVPEMGIKGAGIASGFVALATTSVLLAFVFSKENRTKYRINKFWQPNAEMIDRMVRFRSGAWKKIKLVK